MPEQHQSPSTLDTLMRMVTDVAKNQRETSDKLDALRQETADKFDALRGDWNRRWDEMPDDYPPRREIDQKLAVIDRMNVDHETRLRQIEAQIPNVRFDAYRDTTTTREQAMTANSQTQATVASERKDLDARTIVLLASVPSLIIGLLMLIITIAPHLAYHP